jgi:hypothetical protein
VSCPIGYIGVPGATLLEGTTVSDFCVMKYEAKALNTSTLVVDLDGMRLADGSQWTTLFLSDISARSLADGQPMRAINYTDARFECQELGSGYDLISDYQWMVVAENILRMPINDIDSSANTQLATGYARIGPSTPLSTTSSNDPSISGCDVWQSLGSISNAFTSTCQLRGNVSTFGYNGTATNFSISYGANTIGKSQLRTHVISNGNVLWDFAGNVYEIVRNVTPSGQISYPGASYYQFVTNYPISSGSAEYYDSDDNYLADAPLTLFNSWMAPTASSSTQGLGSINLLVYNSSERQIVRGGAYGTGIGGIFGVSSGLQLYLYAMDRGFRCVYTP